MKSALLFFSLLLLFVGMSLIFTGLISGEWRIFVLGALVIYTLQRANSHG